MFRNLGIMHPRNDVHRHALTIARTSFPRRTRSIKAWRGHVKHVHASLSRVMCYGTIDKACEDTDLLFCIRAHSQQLIAAAKACSV